MAVELAMTEPTALRPGDQSLPADELVAYLDGELAVERARQLESQLAGDAGSREQLRQLQQTWDLLDELPRSGWDERLAQSTVEMVAQAAGSAAPPGGRPTTRSRLVQGLWAAAILLGTSASGYLLVRAGVQRAHHRLLTELPLIERFDSLRLAGSLDYLEGLQQEHLFGLPLPGDLADELPDDAVDGQPESSAGIAPPGAQLSVPQKLILQQRQQRFEAAERSEQEAARNLLRQMEEHPQAAAMWQLLEQYQQWLEALPARERERLRALTEAERLDEVRRLVREQESQRFQQLVRVPLSPRDAEVVFRWLDEFVGRHEVQILQTLPPPLAERILAAERPEARNFMLLATIWRMRPGGPLPQPTAEEFQELLERLSPEVQHVMRQATTPRERSQLAQRWIGAALASRYRPLVPPEELRRFFTGELTDQEQAQLESLPAEQMRQEVLQRYLWHRRGYGRPRINGGSDVQR